MASAKETFEVAVHVELDTANEVRSKPLMPMASMVACSPVRDLFETAATKSQSGAGAPLGASCNTT